MSEWVVERYIAEIERLKEAADQERSRAIDAERVRDERDEEIKRLQPLKSALQLIKLCAPDSEWKREVLFDVLVEAVLTATSALDAAGYGKQADRGN